VQAHRSADNLHPTGAGVRVSQSTIQVVPMEVDSREASRVSAERPAIVAVDSDPDSLAAIERELDRRYAADYRIVAEWTELACHPGYCSPPFASIYGAEREEEIRTLTDPSLRRTLAERNIALRNYRHYASDHLLHRA